MWLYIRVRRRDLCFRQVRLLLGELGCELGLAVTVSEGNGRLRTRK